MAERLYDNNEGATEEYNKDTEVKDVYHCDPCKDEGIELNAAGFCVDCNDYLCKECCQAHKRARPSRHHVLRDSDNIPKPKPMTERKPGRCPDHQNEPINWHCMSHNKCLCDICKQVDHRNCTDIQSVTDVSQDFLSSDKLKEIKDRLMQLLEAFDENLLRITEHTESVKSCYATAIEEVMRTISKMRNEDLERMKAIEVTCNITMETIRSVLNEIEILQQNDQAFVATIKAESQLQAFDERLESVENDNRITRYRYVCEPWSNADGMIGKMFAWKDRRALNIDDLNVETSTDTSVCLITGLKGLSDNRLVIADRNNAKIKLVDMTSKTVISEFKLDWQPWDLTRIGDNTIAVTTYGNKKILIASISDILTIDKSEFNYCQGIVCSNNKLIVSYFGPPHIEIMYLDGTVEQVIQGRDAHGTVRFYDVCYMTQGADTNILYLSHGSCDKVTSMTLDGQIISSFEHEDMLSPRGITVGRDGRIFVCSWYTNKIFEISSDLSEGQVILDEKDGIRNPYSILYDGYKLYVGHDNNSIQVFLP